MRTLSRRGFMGLTAGASAVVGSDLARHGLPADPQIGDHVGDGWQLAEVQWFNRAREFGFLSQGKDKADIRVTSQEVKAAGIDRLTAGRRVYVQCERRPNDYPTAIAIRLA